MFPSRSTEWWDNIVLRTFTERDWIENFRVSKETFYLLCDKLWPHIRRKDTHLRMSITVEHRVAITITPPRRSLSPVTPPRRSRSPSLLLTPSPGKHGTPASHLKVPQNFREWMEEQLALLNKKADICVAKVDHCVARVDNCVAKVNELKAMASKKKLKKVCEPM